MRKISGVFALKPLALCMAVLFTGCESNEQEADIFKTLDECKTTYPDLTAQCEMAFNEALKKAEDTAPKYKTMDDCIIDFGPERCTPHRSADGSSWFMPAMAGFMLARALDVVIGTILHLCSPHPLTHHPITIAGPQWMAILMAIIAIARCALIPMHFALNLA
jgi:hypothetical protein